MKFSVVVGVASIIGTVLTAAQCMNSSSKSINMSQNSSVISTAIAKNGGTAIAGSNVNISQPESPEEASFSIKIPEIKLPKISIKSEQCSQLSVSHPLLRINGYGNDILVKKSAENYPYQGGSLNESGSDRVIYLAAGQILTIEINGSGNDINVERSVAERVNVTSNGANNDVSEI